MRKLFSKLMVATLAMLLLGGVVGCGMDYVKMWQAANPKAKAVFFNEIYNEQWNAYIDVIAMATNLTPLQVQAMSITDPEGLKALIDASPLTEAAKATLRYKKELLQQVEVPIDAFTDLAKAGIAPSPQQEKLILDLLNKLKYRAYMVE